MNQLRSVLIGDLGNNHFGNKKKYIKKKHEFVNNSFFNRFNRICSES